MSKKWTPLWRKAHFEVKMLKAPGVRTTFGNWDVEQVHALVARSTFRSQNVKSTPFSDRFWKLRCRKSGCRCGAKHKMLKTPGVRTILGRSDVVARGRRKGLWTLSKVSKTSGFCRISKNDGRRGTFEEDLQRCIFRGRRSTRDMFIRAVRRSGRWFPEELHFGASDLQVCWDDQHFVWPGITFSWQAQYFRQVDWKNRKTHWYEAVSSALNVPFLKDVSQHCFVFDIVNFEKWGSLAELLPFWRYQAQKLRKSRWIAAFLMLASSKIEEVSQNSFVFKLADR